MKKHIVSIVRYEKPKESVRKAVDLSQGLDHMPSGAKVFIKPNIVYWTRVVEFPKWGMITTSRVIEDLVVLLKDRGIDDITIGEGPLLFDPKDKVTPIHAFETLGYGVLKERYGVESVNVHDRPFREVDLGGGVVLNFNVDILESDFVVNVPVLKTHADTIVSLGLKNLKGIIDVNSRKKCHGIDPKINLDYMVARLSDLLPPSFTLLDGIYTGERGPLFDGRMKRSDILIASADMLSADMVGAQVLGWPPAQVPYLTYAAQNHERPVDLTDIDVVGEKIDDVTSHHEYDWPFNADQTLPLPMEEMGIKGVSIPKQDRTACTYCSFVSMVLYSPIAYAWKGKPWDDVEILTGKKMKPTPGMKKTILVGKCMLKLNKDNQDIQELFKVRGCPPQLKDLTNALQKAGIEVDPARIEEIDKVAGYYMKRYKDKPEFEEDLFRVA